MQCPSSAGTALQVGPALGTGLQGPSWPARGVASPCSTAGLAWSPGSVLEGPVFGNRLCNLDPFGEQLQD